MKSRPIDRSGPGGILKTLFLSGPHTCPWWLGYSFDNPLRRLIHDPAVIFHGLVGPGDTVVDIGCGLGYFSIALAKIVEPTGRVIGLDVQGQMISRARRRAERAGVADRITFRVCRPDRLELDESADFILAFWMLHEVAEPGRLLGEIHAALRPSGRLLIAEPRIHVPAQNFTATVDLASDSGFRVVTGPKVRLSRCVLCIPE